MFDEKPTIEQLQSYVALQKSTKKKHRQKYFLKLVEEVGELSEMIKDDKRFDPDDHEGRAIKNTMEEEMADVLFYLLALANAFNVDLEQAFTRKQQYNNEFK